MKTRNTPWAVALCVALVVGGGVWAGWRPAQDADSQMPNATIAPNTPTAQVEWLTLEEAFRRVSTTPGNQKKILIDVFTDWCGWCKRMELTTFRDPALVAYLAQHYYCVKLNAEQLDTIRLGQQVFRPRHQGSTHEVAVQLAAVEGRLSYPTLAFLDEGFNLIQPIPGFRSAEELMPVVAFLAENHYKNTPWETFEAQWQRTHR